MDIDANRRRGQIPPTCFRCGKSGHLRKDCPQRFDIRLLDSDEREELMMQWLAEKDAALATTPSESVQNSEEREEEVSEEGFGSSSR